MGESAKTQAAAKTARQMRRVGLVIAAAVLMWIIAQGLGGKYGWDVRYAFLFDFAAIAALVWALVVTFQIWRESRG